VGRIVQLRSKNGGTKNSVVLLIEENKHKIDETNWFTKGLIVPLKKGRTMRGGEGKVVENA